MKTKTLLLGAFAALTLVFSSCNKDEVDSSDMVGSWQQTYEFGWVKINGVIDEDQSTDEAVIDGEITIFKKDGTGETDGETFTWKLSGKTLAMNFDEDEETENYTVEKLTSSEAVISISYREGGDGEDTYESYTRSTFKRVK
jgi:hypothetical protein